MRTVYDTTSFPGSSSKDQDPGNEVVYDNNIFPRNCTFQSDQNRSDSLVIWLISCIPKENFTHLCNLAPVCCSISWGRCSFKVGLKRTLVTNLLVYLCVFVRLHELGLVQTSNFSCAEPNANVWAQTKNLKP